MFRFSLDKAEQNYKNQDHYQKIYSGRKLISVMKVRPPSVYKNINMLMLGKVSRGGMQNVLIDVQKHVSPQKKLSASVGALPQSIVKTTTQLKLT